MPTYTYQCDNCGVRFDRHQKFSEKPLSVCPECSKKALRKVYTPVGIVFKGSGGGSGGGGSDFVPRFKSTTEYTIPSTNGRRVRLNEKYYEITEDLDFTFTLAPCCSFPVLIIIQIIVFIPPLNV